MKRVLLIIVAVAVVLIGICNYVMNTPEFALRQIMTEINSSGMSGLYPHLTRNARSAVDTAASFTQDNKTLSSLISLAGQGLYVNVLKSEIQNIHWSVADIMRGKENSSAILSFNYEDKLIGTIDLLMVRENGSWKIDGIGFPSFITINW